MARRLTAREMLDREILEDRGPYSLERRLTDALDAAGALAYHPRNSRRDRRGFPDWTIITKDGRLAFAELKREGATLRPEQRDWGLALSEIERRTGGRVRYFVVTPSTWEAFERWLF